MSGLYPGTVDSSYWNTQTKLDTATDWVKQQEAAQKAAQEAQIKLYQQQGLYGNDGNPVAPPSAAVFGAAPAPTPAPSGGIINGAMGTASWGPGGSSAPSPAPAPGGAAFGAAPAPGSSGTEVTKPLQVSAPGQPSFGPSANTTQPDPVKALLNQQNWQGQGKDAAGAKAMYDAAIANGWSLDQLGASNNTNGDWWRSLFSQYNLNWPAGGQGGSFGPGSGTPATGGTGGGSTGIIASQTKSAQLGTPTDWNVTPEQTVEGRIQSIINPQNPIMAQARARSLDQMNARGLANSSLAVTAGESAAYDAAIPIAQSDAATFAKAAGYNADQRNQFARENVSSENQFRMQDMNNAAQRDLALINRDTQIQLSKLNSEQQQQAAKLELDNQKLLQTNAKAAEAFNTAMSAINNVNMNDRMDADTKTRTVASIWRDTQIQLNTLGRVAGLNLSADLDFADMPGFDSQGKYVGFEDGSAVTRNTSGIIAGAQNGTSGSMPQYINGQSIGWDVRNIMSNTTPRQDYNAYVSRGGKMTPTEWWNSIYGYGTGESGGPGNPSSSPSANNSSTPSAAAGPF